MLVAVVACLQVEMAPVGHVQSKLSLELACPALPVRFALNILLTIATVRDVAVSAESTASTTTASAGAAATTSSTTSTICATSMSVTSHERLTQLLIRSGSSC